MQAVELHIFYIGNQLIIFNNMAWGYSKTDKKDKCPLQPLAPPPSPKKIAFLTPE